MNAAAAAATRTSRENYVRKNRTRSSLSMLSGYYVGVSMVARVFRFERMCFFFSRRRKTRIAARGHAKKKK